MLCFILVYPEMKGERLPVGSACHQSHSRQGRHRGTGKDLESLSPAQGLRVPSQGPLPCQPHSCPWVWFPGQRGRLCRQGSGRHHPLLKWTCLGTSFIKHILLGGGSKPKPARRTHPMWPCTDVCWNSARRILRPPPSNFTSRPWGDAIANTGADPTLGYEIRPFRESAQVL